MVGAGIPKFYVKFWWPLLMMKMMMTTKRFVTIVFDSIVGVTPGQEGRAGGGAALFHILIAVVIITITISININIAIAKHAFIYSLFGLSQLKKTYLGDFDSHATLGRCANNQNGNLRWHLP